SARPPARASRPRACCRSRRRGATRFSRASSGFCRGSRGSPRKAARNGSPRESLEFQVSGWNARKSAVLCRAIMKRHLVLCFVLAAGVSAASAQEMVERIVARVNDGLVTQSEYDKRLALAARSANVPAPTDEIRISTLEDMIKEHLLEDRAKEMS